MKTELTERDSYVLCKALAYAIQIIEALPERWQEWGDKDDMIALLDLLTHNPEYFRTVAQGHIQRRGFDVVGGELVLAERKSEVIEGVFPKHR